MENHIHISLFPILSSFSSPGASGAASGHSTVHLEGPNETGLEVIGVFGPMM
jgi:hypothetical protein